MRTVTGLALVLVMGVAGGASSQTCVPGDDKFTLQFGNSWGHSTQGAAAGEALEVIGRINKTQANQGAPIVYDLATTTEYTFHIAGVDVDLFTEGGASPDSFIYGGGGTITIYEDLSLDAPRPPTANPPNGDVPSLFTDGTAILVGSIDELLIDFRNGSQTSPPFPDSTGVVRGKVTFTGGTRVGELISPIWVWNAAVFDNAGSGPVPAGYNWYWSGELKNDCLPTGACCFCDGTCQDGLTADACAVAGGVYAGDGTTCATTTCPVVGACCFPDGTCADGVYEADCLAAGGVFYACTPCGGITCVNATEQRSWGSIKGIYR